MSDPIGESPQYLERGDGHRLAYHRTAGRSPGVVFLGGFRSDMTGTKALTLEAWARQRGQAFLRFDYLGHGQSSGDFEEGSIGRWAEDAIAALDQLTEGPQILVGSSMGGWIMLLAALARPERVVGRSPRPGLYRRSLVGRLYAGAARPDPDRRSPLPPLGIRREPTPLPAPDRGRPQPPAPRQARPSPAPYASYKAAKTPTSRGSTRSDWKRPMRATTCRSS